MQAIDRPFGIHLPLQTSAAKASAAAIAQALENFYDNPTTSNKLAAVDALQAHLSGLENGRVEAG